MANCIFPDEYRSAHCRLSRCGWRSRPIRLTCTTPIRPRRHFFRLLLTALPSNCDARIEPRQINAIVSELISFAECIDPTGTWDCNSLKNLCAAFTEWAALNNTDVVDGVSIVGSGTWLTRISLGLLIVGRIEGNWMPQKVQIKRTVTPNSPPTALDPGEFAVEMDNPAVCGLVCRWCKTRPARSCCLTLRRQPAVAAAAGSLSVEDPPPSPGQGHLVVDSDTTIFSLYYDDGNSAAWVQINDVPARLACALRYSAIVSSTQLVQARKNIYAAPFDAMAYSGMQINGSMEVNQELPGAATTATGYTVDGWHIHSEAGAMVVSSAPGIGPWLLSRPAIPNLITVSTAAASSPPAILRPYTTVEGWRLLRLGLGAANAQPITIGFWTAHTKVGTYSVGVKNSASNRSYVTAYTQVVLSAWEYKTVKSPATPLERG